jgi:alpha-tubulin suppressor-like RCC1 family protein
VSRDEDIADVAVGESHILVLTRRGEVFARGDHSSGQLGLGVERAGLDGGWAGEWTKVCLPLRAGQTIVGVAAGSRTSFVLVKNSEGTVAS